MKKRISFALFKKGYKRIFVGNKYVYFILNGFNYGSVHNSDTYFKLSEIKQLEFDIVLISKLTKLTALIYNIDYDKVMKDIHEYT